MFFQSYLSFRDLEPSCPVTEELLVEQIKTIPLDVILGTVAMICTGFDKNIGFFDTSYQAPFLNQALVDDFPRSIGNLDKIYIPGRTPITGGRHMFMHEQNLTWLVNCALFHSDSTVETPEICPIQTRRIFRLLLLINNLLPNSLQSSFKSLESRREFCLDWIRNYQHDHFFQQLPHELFVELARNKVIFEDYLPKHFSDINVTFQSVLGVDTHLFFQALTGFISHFTNEIRPGRHWMTLSTFLSNIKEPYKSHLEKILSSYLTTPAEYRKQSTEWLNSQSGRLAASRPDTDLKLACIPLQKTPLIWPRKDHFICPIPQLFLRKITDDLFFKTLDSGQLNSGDQQGGFASKIGLAFEDYGASIVRKFAKDHGWKYEKSPKDSVGNELTDIYLQTQDIGIMIEFKADRPGLPFVHGKNDDRVLGPKAKFINDLDRTKYSLEEIKRQDSAYLTESIWQINTNIQPVKKWASENFGQEPMRLFTIVVFLSNYLPDEVVIKGYIKPLLSRVSSNQEIIVPQYLHIRDFEALFELGISGQVDPSSLIENKILEAPDCRFDLFLKERINNYPAYSVLLQESQQLLTSSIEIFFKTT